MQQLPQTWVKSPTVVIEAAIFLIQEGVFKIPDLGIQNVKQCRAFLLTAIWFQERMNKKWELESSSPMSGNFDEFVLVLIGPGGTGKTAVLKSAEALITFFLGGDAVRKLAPSNSAARLLRGDTLHALCKLPFGGAQLTSKAGKLKTPKLIELRKLWEKTVAAFLDEISMVSADQLCQADVRMRQAKQRSDSLFGNLGHIKW